MTSTTQASDTRMRTDVQAETIEIAYLADHPEHTETIARWLQDAFGHLRPEVTLDDTIATFRERAVKDRIPLTLIALEGGELVSTVSLKAEEPFTDKTLGPWVGGVYTREDKRGLGIAFQLMERLQQIALTLGHPRLYLSAVEAESLYRRLGWQTIDRVDSLGEEVALMEKVLE